MEDESRGRVVQVVNPVWRDLSQAQWPSKSPVRSERLISGYGQEVRYANLGADAEPCMTRRVWLFG